jgi:hypothetical protein
MIITDRFVFIHMPKTGGTFVTAVLSKLHGAAQPDPQAVVGVFRLHKASVRSFFRHPAHRKDLLGGYGPLANVEPKHGTCHDVPLSEAKKPILSSVRNPYDWYVSQYEFGWWKRLYNYEPLDDAVKQVLKEFEKDHPHFPHISFEEFIEYCERESLIYDWKEPHRFGLYTHLFVRYYFRNPPATLSRLVAEGPLSAALKSEMFDVRLIRTDHLNQDLTGFLASMGYKKEDLAFISGLKKIRPSQGGRRHEKKWENYYTTSLKRYIREKDWALFQMFPEFDV